MPAYRPPLGHHLAERNIIHEIGNRPILEVLRDTLEGMSHEEQKRAHGNVFIGLVMDEYKAQFETGDFLVRNLAAIDPKTGSVAIATPLRVGQNRNFKFVILKIAEADFSRQLEQPAHASDSVISSAPACAIASAEAPRCMGSRIMMSRLSKTPYPNCPSPVFFVTVNSGKSTAEHGYTATQPVWACSSNESLEERTHGLVRTRLNAIQRCFRRVEITMYRPSIPDTRKPKIPIAG